MLYKYRLPLVLLIYAICFIILFPWFQYIFDSDNMGYFMVTKRLATGDFYNSINGYWSPLHAWLAVPFYKAGLNELDSFRIVSGLAGAGILYLVNRLMKKVPVSEQLTTITLFISALMVLAYVYYNQAADILVCLMLLIYTDIITEKDFFENRSKNIVCGLIACFSYFAKTYALPFFLVHFTLVQLVLYRNSARTDRKKLLFRNWISGMISFFLLALPWIYALYTKYHFVTYGYSGKLNFNWEMYDTWGDYSRKLYAISPGPLVFHWEDPISYPWNSTQHPSYFSSQVLTRQIGTLIRNIKKALECFNFISFTIPAVMLALGVYAVHKKNTVLKLIFLVLAILPAGYLLVAIETRYLWTMGFLVLITGTLLLSEVLRISHINTWLRRLCWCIFWGSFLLFPLYTLKNLMGQEKDMFELAAEFKSKGVQGSFVSNHFEYIVPERKLAYLTGSKLYQLSREPNNYEELLQACRESHIQYVLFTSRDNIELEGLKNSVLYKNAVKEITLKSKYLTVLKMY